MRVDETVAGRRINACLTLAAQAAQPIRRRTVGSTASRGELVWRHATAETR